MWGFYEYKGKVKPTSNCIEGGYSFVFKILILVIKINYN